MKLASIYAVQVRRKYNIRKGTQGEKCTLRRTLEDPTVHRAISVNVARATGIERGEIVIY